MIMTVQTLLSKYYIKSKRDIIGEYQDGCSYRIFNAVWKNWIEIWDDRGSLCVFFWIERERAESSEKKEFYKYAELKTKFLIIRDLDWSHI